MERLGINVYSKRFFELKMYEKIGSPYYLTHNLNMNIRLGTFTVCCVIIKCGTVNKEKVNVK